MTGNLQSILSLIAPVLAAFALSAGLTPVVRAAARAKGAVAHPKADRWHKKPTALLGGIAIFLAVILVSIVTAPHTLQVVAIMVGATFLFLVGLVDDFWQLKPYQKLVAQLMAAAVVVSSGVALPWTPWQLANMTFAVLWLVGITNAVNLLDNMDGLAAGVAAIASSFLSANFWIIGQVGESLLLAAFAAALLGFLIYNFNPATIFMGDCGSMFIGFLLAGTAMMGAGGGRSRSVVAVLAVPVLILLIPIFDTMLVTLLRKLSGRAVSQGGQDHTSHRLVALGMSERRAVCLLYGLALVAGILALSIRQWPFDIALAVLSAATVVLALVGVYLAGVAVYDPIEINAARQRPVVAFLVNLSHKRRLFEVLLDVVLIVLSYFTAYALVFGSVTVTGAWREFLQVAPILVAVKLPTLLVMGVYRGLWRYVDVDDLIVYMKATLAASVAAALVVLAIFRFEDYSRTVFVLDGAILLLFLTGTRFSIRVLRRLIAAGAPTADRRRVLIYGAGDSGELLLRELRDNCDYRLDAIGFVDDDPHKKGKTIHGLRVFGGNGALPSIIREQAIDEVIISSRSFLAERVNEIQSQCQTASVVLRRMKITVDPVPEFPVVRQIKNA